MHLRCQDNMDPRVSIITPLYNGADYIEKAVRSVQRQSYMRWELIVVDDASSDQSPKIVERLLSDDPRIKLLRLKKNCGAAVARNYGINAATGRYIAFLDCDDEWMPGKLAAQVERLSATKAALCFAAYIRVDERGKVISRVGVPVALSYREELMTNYIGCLTAMYDRQLVGKVHMPEYLPCHEDYPMWLEILRKSGPAVGIPVVLAKYSVRAGSLSSNKLQTARQVWRIYREIEKLPLFSSYYYFINQSGRAILRNYFPRLAIKVGWLHTAADSKNDSIP